MVRGLGIGTEFMGDSGVIFKPNHAVQRFDSKNRNMKNKLDLDGEEKTLVRDMMTMIRETHTHSHTLAHSFEHTHTYDKITKTTQRKETRIKKEKWAQSRYPKLQENYNTCFSNLPASERSSYPD